MFAFIIFVVVFVVIFVRLAFRNTRNIREIINKLLNKNCSDGPILNHKDFPWSKEFRKHQNDIKQEYLNYCKEYNVPAYKDIDSELSGGTIGWKSLFLRVFNNDTEIIDKFPITKKLINSCPCTTAYFSKLEPNVHIKAHEGLYKGVIRYHLSIIIPKKWKDCYIIVDGKKLYWRENHDLLFDDTHTHEVFNNTNEERVVLFMDVKRDFKNTVIDLINTIVLKLISINDASVDLLVSKANILNGRKLYKN